MTDCFAIIMTREVVQSDWYPFLVAAGLTTAAVFPAVYRRGWRLPLFGSLGVFIVTGWMSRFFSGHPTTGPMAYAVAAMMVLILCCCTWQKNPMTAFLFPLTAFLAIRTVCLFELYRYGFCFL